MLLSSSQRRTFELATAAFEENLYLAQDFLTGRGLGDERAARGHRPGEGSDVRRAWIPGHEGRYSVTDDGRVWTHRHPTPVPLAGSQGSTQGHRKVNLGCGSGRSQWVHRLVLRAFAGEPAEGQVARHLDGDPTNNALSNLAWGTHAENNADMVAHGRSTRGSANKRSLLTEEQVLEIRSLRHLHVSEVASRFGIKPNTVYGIWSRRAWGWLDAG